MPHSPRGTRRVVARLCAISNLWHVLLFGHLWVSAIGGDSHGIALVTRSQPDRTGAKYAKYVTPTSEILDVDPKELMVREGHQNMGHVVVTLLEDISLPLNVSIKGGFKPTNGAAMFPDLAVFPASWLFMPGGPMQQTVRIMVDEDDHSLALHKARLTWEAHSVGLTSNDPYYDDVSMIVMDYHIAGGVHQKSPISMSWAFVLCFFLVPMLYLIGGFVYNVRVKHYAGIDAIPNLLFWLHFCELVKDGCAFSLVKLGIVLVDEDEEEEQPIRREPTMSDYEAVA